MLNLDARKRHELDIGADLVGIVDVNSTFYHAECFDTEDSLTDALADEGSNVVVLKSDDWKLEVGPCGSCGRLADEEPGESA